MRELLFATGNPGKLPGLSLPLSGLSFTALSLADLSLGADVVESASTFEGNAIIKAMTYAMRSGKLTLADDSGFVVDVLDGRPGVLSARYVVGTDADRYQKVLEELLEVPDDMRGAHYVAVVAICDPDRNFEVRTAVGRCDGVVLREPRGNEGFGYDPIFFSTDMQKTFAEASVEEKSAISHRGRAMREIRKTLELWL